MPSADGGAVHVFVHAVHVARRFEVVAAGVEADAFADQGDGLFCACLSQGEVDDGGIFLRAALGHGDKGARAHLAQFLQVVFFHLPALCLGQVADAFAVQAGRQVVGGQHGQFPRQRVALGLRALQTEIVCAGMAEQGYFSQGFAGVFFLALGKLGAIEQGDINRQIQRCDGVVPACR